MRIFLCSEPHCCGTMGTLEERYAVQSLHCSLSAHSPALAKPFLRPLCSSAWLRAPVLQRLLAWL